jgi:hypothetical protein
VFWQKSNWYVKKEILEGREGRNHVWKNYVLHEKKNWLKNTILIIRFWFRFKSLREKKNCVRKEKFYIIDLLGISNIYNYKKVIVNIQNYRMQNVFCFLKNLFILNPCHFLIFQITNLPQLFPPPPSPTHLWMERNTLH